MSATADRPSHPLFRLAAAAGLLLMTIGLADGPFASTADVGTCESASQASCDTEHSDSGCSHPDHPDESDIPVVNASDSLGPPRRLCSHRTDGGTAVALRPPVRPPSS